MSDSGGHAVVVGAGMAGLLAARALSEFYETVTVVERDRLRKAPVARRGIPQGRHLHSMLSRGWQLLEELLPGFQDELVAAGAHILNDGDLSRIYARFGRYGFNRSEKVKDPAALVVYLASRPFLEFQLRERIAGISGVRFLDHLDLITPIATSDRITGVRVARRDTGAEFTLDADLTVDAMGRATRTPAFLERLGYTRPVEQTVTARGTYSSQFLRIPDGMINEKMVLVRPGNDVVVGLLAYEHDTWVLTVGQAGIGAEPPTDLAGMLALAALATPPAIMAGLRAAEPIGTVAVTRLPTAVWRRYDRLTRLPAGLLVIGDALCTFDPIHGQGMTLAALQAATLRDRLRDELDPSDFFRATTACIAPVWTMNRDAGRRLSSPPARRSISGRLQGWATDQALRAAEHDIVLTERFFRVTSLIDPPTSLQDPNLLARALTGNLRRRLREGR